MVYFTSQATYRLPQWCGFVAFWLVLLCPPCPAAEPAQSSTERSRAETQVITSGKQFWLLSENARNSDSNVDLHVLVNYIDLVWGLLWCEDAQGTFFLKPGAGFPDIKPRQRYHLQGVLNTKDGLRPSSVQLLEDPAPPPLKATAFIRDYQRLDLQFIEVEGYVDRQSNIDARHQQLRIIVNGIAVETRVLLENGTQLDNLEGAMVRACGVFNRNSDALGQSVVSNLWCHSTSSISRLGWLVNDPMFTLPATPIERIPALIGKSGIKVLGTVVSQDIGFSLKVQDNTGQVIIRSPQTDQLNPGDRIEAVGLPGVSGLDTLLTRALFRKTTEKNQSYEGPEGGRLRLAEQILALPLEEARRSMPARIIGIVSWAHPKADYFYLQDATSGLRVHLSSSALKTPEMGSVYQVTGYTSIHDQGPAMEAEGLLKTGTLEIPRPRQITLEQARTGIGLNSPVEIIGFLDTATQLSPEWQQLGFITESGAFSSILPADVDISKLSGSILRIRGINTMQPDGGIHLIQSSLADFERLEARPPNVYAIPSHPLNIRVGNLRRPGELHWLRTSGLVTLHIPGSCLYIQDDANSLCILSKSTDPLQPGDKVIVVGIPGREAYRDVLKEGFYLKTESNIPISAAYIARPSPQNTALDGRLIRIEGILLDSTNLNISRRWLVQSSGIIVSCELPVNELTAPPRFPLGSSLEITGVARIVRDEYGAPNELKILLRSSSDLNLLDEPTWWNARNSLTVAGVLALCSIGLVILILILRRTIQRQTSIITAQHAEELRLKADLERSARLESLGLLAGGIAHDFNNILTVVAGNVTLALMEEGVEENAGPFLREAEKGALRARTLTQQLLTFAKGGNPIRKPVDLAALAKQESEQTIGQAAIDLYCEFPSDLKPAFVDKDQITQVIHHLVSNAAQAMSGTRGRLTLALRNESVNEGNIALKPGEYLVLAISDNGPGIPEPIQGKIFDPYFSTKAGHHGLGLSMVRSIVARHEGHITVSTSSEGSTFTLWVPAANTAVPAAQPKPSPAPLSTSMGEKRRILFMDDEAPIRLMATGLFRRLGYEATLCADGTEAVREFRTALERGRPFHLVISDLSVPGGMGGKELIENIRKMDTRVPAVVSSGYSSDPVMANFQDYGFTAVLPKPYQIEDLARVIHSELNEVPKG